MFLSRNVLKQPHGLTMQLLIQSMDLLFPLSGQGQFDRPPVGLAGLFVDEVALDKLIDGAAEPTLVDAEVAGEVREGQPAFSAQGGDHLAAGEAVDSAAAGGVLLEGGMQACDAAQQVSGVLGHASPFIDLDNDLEKQYI